MGLRTAALCALAAFATSAGLSAQVGSVIEDLKLSNTLGSLPFPLTMDENFGVALDGLGDLNGDGTLELLVGSPSDDSSGAVRGAVQILSFAADGTVLAGFEISHGTNGFPSALDRGDAFGSGVAALGDVDGDGITDIAVGARGDDDGSLDRGAIWILFLNANGTVRATQKISATSGGFVGPVTSRSSFGTALTGLGDLDGDGIPDLAAGDPLSGGFLAGATWILFLNADGTVKAENKFDETATIAGLQLNLLDQFGSDVEGIGDLNGDGVPDICIGSPGRGADFPGQRGAVHVLFLNPSGTAQGLSLVSIEDPTEEYGSAIGALGDLDGDGNQEIAVGQFETKVWVVSMDSAGVTQGFHLIDPSVGSTLIDPNATDAFGYSVASIGDLDGDGVPDLAVGDFFDDDGAEDAGAVYLFRLSDGDPDAAFTVGNAQGCAPLSVSFTDASAGSGVLSYLWDFGDGFNSTQQHPTHIYSVSGTYSVALTVAGSDGSAREIARNAVTVLAAPQIDYEADPTVGLSPLDVAFDSDSSVGTLGWSWDFGDGSSSTLEDPTHSYAVPGTYSVSLTATCAGGSSTVTKLDYISVLDPNQASVTVDNGSGINFSVLIPLTDPELGTTWMGQVDGSPVGGTGVVFLFGYEAPLLPGFFTAFGELLVDPTSTLVTLNSSALNLGVADFALPVPNDTQLLGFTFSGQAFLTNLGGGAIITNRLDFRLGF